LVDANITGLERKKRFREKFEDIRVSFPTFGIVSNGYSQNVLDPLTNQLKFSALILFLLTTKPIQI